VLLRPSLLGNLLRQPRWLMATVVSAFSFGAQAVALAFGPLALVQPVAAMDLLFALPLLAHRHQFRLRPRDWAAAGAVAGGIAAFLALAPPSAGKVVPGLGDWAWVLVLVALALAVVAPVALRAPTRSKRP
jgi:peptidoglycan/LPS O-acetylase OafA/YrhL